MEHGTRQQPRLGRGTARSRSGRYRHRGGSLLASPLVRAPQPGKTARVLVFATGARAGEAREAGADYVGALALQGPLLVFGFAPGPPQGLCLVFCSVAMMSRIGWLQGDVAVIAAFSHLLSKGRDGASGDCAVASWPRTGGAPLALNPG